MNRVETCTRQLYDYGIYIYKSLLDFWNIKTNANNEHTYTILYTVKDTDDNSSSKSENDEDIKAQLRHKFKAQFKI